MPERKQIRLATRKSWVLGGLILSLVIIVVVARYGKFWPEIFQKDQGRAQAEITRPATWQPFDERLSLSMPVPFGPALNFPLEKFPVEVREKSLKMTQRTAYFNGVYVVVMRMRNSPETKGSVGEILSRAFSRSASPPSAKMPKINLTKADGVYESGAIRFLPSSVKAKVK